MSTAEYVLVFVSLVLGLAAADILTSLHRMLRARRRIRWDWASPIAAFVVVMLILMEWWSLYPEGGQGKATIGGFLPTFVELVLLFLLSAAVLPDEVPSEGLHLRDYYHANAAYFWTLLTALMAWSTAAHGVRVVAGGGSLLSFLLDRPVDIVIAAAFASLIFIRRRWWHALVLAVALLGPVDWLSRSIG